MSDLPLLGRLFAYNHKDATQTDIILTLTPHIVRILDLNEADLRPFRSGATWDRPLSETPAPGPPRDREDGVDARVQARRRRRAARGSQLPAPDVPAAARRQAARHTGAGAGAEEAGWWQLVGPRDSLLGLPSSSLL